MLIPVLAYRVQDFQKIIDRVIKQAQVLGRTLPQPQLVSKTERAFGLGDNTGRVYYVDQFNYEVPDAFFELSPEWRLRAASECVGASESGEDLFLIKVIGGEELGFDMREKYAGQLRSCQHCHVDRRRNNTYLLQSKKNPDDFRLIGSTCVKSFLPNVGSEVESYLTSLDKMLEAYDRASSDDFGPTGRGSQNYSLRTFLGAAALSTLDRGFVSSKMAMDKPGMVRTSQDALYILSMTPRDHRERFKDKEEIIENANRIAKETYEYFRKMYETPNMKFNPLTGKYETKLSDFDQNLAVIVQSNVVDPRGGSVGFAASMPNSYLRDTQQQQERKAGPKYSSTQDPLGTEGETLYLDFIMVGRSDVKYSQFDKSSYYDFYGRTADDRALQFKWGEFIQLSGDRNLAPGQSVRISGRLGRTYQRKDGVLVNVLTHVKLLAPGSVPAKRAVGRVYVPRTQEQMEAQEEQVASLPRLSQTELQNIIKNYAEQIFPFYVKYEGEVTPGMYDFNAIKDELAAMSKQYYPGDLSPQTVVNAAFQIARNKFFAMAEDINRLTSSERIIFPILDRVGGDKKAFMLAVEEKADPSIDRTMLAKSLSFQYDNNIEGEYKNIEQSLDRLAELYKQKGVTRTGYQGDPEVKKMVEEWFKILSRKRYFMHRFRSIQDFDEEIRERATPKIKYAFPDNNTLYSVAMAINNTANDPKFNPDSPNYVDINLVGQQLALYSPAYSFRNTWILLAYTKVQQQVRSGIYPTPESREELVDQIVSEIESMYDDEVNANKVSEFQKFDEDTFGQFLYLVMMRINKMIVAEYK